MHLKKNNQRLLDIILDSALELVNSKSGNVRIIDKETNVLKRLCGKNIVTNLDNDGRIGFGKGICGHVVETGKPVKVNDVTKDPRWKHFFDNKKGIGTLSKEIETGKIMHSEISVPLKVDERIIGTIDALKSKPNGFSDEDFEMFQEVALIAGNVYKRRTTQAKLEAVSDITTYYQTVSKDDLNKSLDDILKKSLKTINCRKGSIAILKKEIEGKNTLDYLSVTNIDKIKNMKYQNIKEEVIDAVMQCRESKNLSAVTEYINHKGFDPTIESEIVVPIIFETKFQGILMVASSQENRFDDDDLMILDAIANRAGILIHNMELIREREENYKQMENELIQNLMHLSGMIAHQINTPLAGIQIHFSNIKDKLNMGRYDLSENIDCIYSSIDKISTIIKKIKEFTKKASLQLESLNLHEVLDEALNFTQGINTRENINVIKNYDKNGIKRFGFDRFKMHQVFINIIENAFKAMNEKGGRLVINTVQDNSNTVIIFEDNGKGIPFKNKTEIFKSFFTTDEVHGTGLGLSISKRFVELHDGNIKIKSIEGEGARFILTLPNRNEGTQNEKI